MCLHTYDPIQIWPHFPSKLKCPFQTFFKVDLEVCFPIFSNKNLCLLFRWLVLLLLIMVCVVHYHVIQRKRACSVIPGSLRHPDQINQMHLQPNDIQQIKLWSQNTRNRRMYSLRGGTFFFDDTRVNVVSDVMWHTWFKQNTIPHSDEDP